ncbi:creatininase family protein [Pacificibacter marinus]|uniref:Creatinine amidohydrolase n=1 Tax=Pacificibacter marinus TaxID=658057 RepID=A0A1Y5RGB1_9RHOB|nr:creatininase family protein [Pacificibacter marinus]SEK21824.1 creatinine amidohydrolase [Pacificibacter marinus]SLN15948.1 Creatinine amidohydrolase [Pacificibacter marinus]
MRRFDWSEFRTTEFASMDPEKTIVILPTAAIEQHGPHLPVGVDTYINNGMLAQLRATLPDDINVLILPVQAVGKSNEHIHAKGTLTYTAKTALEAWTEIGLSVARAGLKKMVIVNSHGGNLDLISILGRELRVQAGMMVVKCQWGNFGAPEGMYSEQENKFGIHGGDVETSLMLQFKPHLVDMSQAKDFRSTAETATISPIGAINLAWVSKDLNPEGTVGEAHLATAEKGAATCAHQVAGFIDLLGQLRDLPSDNYARTIPD